MSERTRIFTDGASRGNPGPAAYGYVIQQEGEDEVVGNGVLDETTNNVAEYTALIKALEHARQLGLENITVFSDSELMVKQIHREYKVKNDELRGLFHKVNALLDSFASRPEITHIKRTENKQADRLCNDALDQAVGKKKKSSGKKQKKPARRADIDEQAVECLQSVAAVWANGDLDSAKPKDVWDQLWSILEEGDVLK